MNINKKRLNGFVDIKSDSDDRNFHASQQIFCLPFITGIIIIIIIIHFNNAYLYLG